MDTDNQEKCLQPTWESTILPNSSPLPVQRWVNFPWNSFTGILKKQNYCENLKDKLSYHEKWRTELSSCSIVTYIAMFIPTIIDDDKNAGDDMVMLPHIPRSRSIGFDPRQSVRMILL